MVKFTKKVMMVIVMVVVMVILIVMVIKCLRLDSSRFMSACSYATYTTVTQKNNLSSRKQANDHL